MQKLDLKRIRERLEEGRPTCRIDMRDLLDEVERLREERRWRPVSEQPPNERVYVHIPQRDCLIAEYHGCGWWNDGAGYINGVTHWIPLPEPPEQEAPDVRNP